MPAIIAWLVGAFVFKMNGALLLGAVAGGRCNSAGLRAAQETSRSNVPALSYPGTAEEFMGGPLPVARRSYQLEQSRPVGHRLGELRRTYPLVAIERVLRRGQCLEPADDIVLQPHDTLALYGRVPRLINAAAAIGPEVDVPALRDIRCP